VHKRHRRGRRRRTNLRLALQLVLAIFAIATAAALSVGVIHVIERPVSPFEPASDQERRSGSPLEPAMGEPVMGEPELGDPEPGDPERVEPAIGSALDAAEGAGAPVVPTGG